MKKTIVAGLAAGLLALMSISAFAGQTIDATHRVLEGMSCERCHFSADVNGNEINPGDQCVGCHINEGSGYTDSAAPYVSTHKDFTCQTCHNPHVSLQYGEGATPMVAGDITAADNSTGVLTLSYTLSPTAPGAWSVDPTLWFGKTKLDRGLILWETVGVDNYSFMVSAADNSTITVEGGVPAGLAMSDLENKSFELHYGQMIATAVSPTAVSPTDGNYSYRGANATLDTVDFPSMGTTGATAGNMYVNETGTGICQRCHTTVASKHWNTTYNDGHNVDRDCVECHKHDNKIGPTFGFGLGSACDVCHPNYLNNEPPSSGAHAMHAGTSGGYLYDCVVCHTGGMASSATPDDKIQIGFNLSSLAGSNFSGINTNYDGVNGTLADAFDYGTSYAGMNNGTTSTGGSFTCSNIYCHSSGEGAQKDGKCLTGEIVGNVNDSPKWDGTSVDTDGNSCNNCHPKFRKTATKELGSAGLYMTFFPDIPNVDKHYFHIVMGAIECYNCHNTTIPYPSVMTATGYTIPAAGKQTHVNGKIDIEGGGINSGTAISIAWDPAGQSCVVSGCHGSKTWVNSPADCIPDVDLCDSIVPAPFTGSYADIEMMNLANGYPATAGGGGVNYDPVINLTVEQINSNVIRFTDNSIDIDNVDSAKNYCFGGGHNGTTGKAKITTAMAGKVIPRISYDGIPSTFDIVLTPAMRDTTTVPGSTVVAYQALYYDNNPMTTPNRQTKTWKTAALDPIDGTVDGTWNTFPLDLNIDDSSSNLMAEIISISTPAIVNNGDGTCSASLTVQAIDPDANVAGKDDAICGTGAHGHDGTTEAKVKVYLNSASSVVAKGFLDNTDPVVTWTAPFQTASAPCVTGTNFWYFVEIFDGHRQDSICRSAGYTQQTESGWLSTPVPAP